VNRCRFFTRTSLLVKRAVFVGALAIFSVHPCEAAKKSKGSPSAIAHLYPAGGKVGSSFSCTVAGAFTKNATTAWADDPGLVFKGTDKPDKFDVSIAPNVPLGPHLVRFYNEDGASPPRVLMVGAIDEVMEKGPDNDVHHPQVLEKIPVTVNGVLERAGEADIYSFHAEAGRWIVLALDGYGLGVQMDPALRLVDEHGVEVALSHDTHNLDPRIAYEVKKSSTYSVEVMAFTHPPAADVTLKGSADNVYRLTITDAPYAFSVLPCAVQRGGAPEVKYLGWNCGPGMLEPQAHSFPLAEARGNRLANGLISVPTPNGETALAVLVNSPVIVEAAAKEKNGVIQNITLPCVISGQVKSPKDESRFRFTAKKSDNVEFNLCAARLHSPLSPVLCVEDAQGKVLKRSGEDIEGGTDPSLKWSAPADGDYTVCVGDLYARGDWDFFYALECGPSQPHLTATLDANAYKLEPGKTAEIKVNAKITGSFKGKLLAHAEGLPDGVSAKEVEVPAKGGEMKLVLSAAEEAMPANQPFAVVLTTSSPDAPLMTKATYDLRGTEPRGDRLINEDSSVWLTVTGK
jgi:hypothetical protein